MSTYANVKPGSQNERILDCLRDGKFWTTAGIHRRAGTSRLNSRISELRSRGYNIEHRRVHGVTEPRSHQYRWADAPGLPPAVLPEIAEAAKIPRTPQTRYRIYTRVYDDLRCIAACADPESLGVALLTLAAEGEFEGKLLGVMDAPTEGVSGEWLIKPWCPE